MNTQIQTRTEAQIANLKFSEQAPIYNELATALGIKQIKKFRDKATGISRIMQIQEQYIEERDEILAEQKAKSEERDEILAEQKAKSEERDEILAEQKAKSEERDEILAEQKAKSEERDEILAEQKAKSEEKVEKSRKAVQSETLAVEYELSTKSNGYTPKEDSINEFILNLVKAEQPITGQDIIDLIVSEFKRPRGSRVTVGFAKTSLNWLVRNNYIKQV